MTDQAAEGLLSAWLQRRRVSAVRPHLQGRVLDYGCGNGALAAHADASRYLGYDRDPMVLEIARQRYPMHAFTDELPQTDGFDTIACLALIEHVQQPSDLLETLQVLLRVPGRIVLTTPHPRYEWIHDVGSTIGLFSRAAHEEHESLLDQAGLEHVAQAAGMRMSKYHRFLFGANQLAVLETT